MKRRRRFRKALKITLLVLVVLTIALVASLTFVADIQLDDLRSLNTIRKVDDYPLYVMRYYGDYGLKDTQTGRGFKGVWKFVYEQLRPQDPDSKCSCFSAMNKQADRVFGRNYDWHNTNAALLLFTDPPDKYASVSMVDITYFDFDPIEPGLLDYLFLIGTPYLPTDGMNECGVTVAAMSVPQADGGNDPNKETLGISCLMRQILDRASSVNEAIALTEQYNVVFTYGPKVHLLISDASGNAAIIEFIDGSPTVVKNTEPFQVCTNFIISGRDIEQVLKSSWSWRYNTMYTALQGSQSRVTSEQPMELLKNVSQNSTIWSAVYGQSTGKIQLAMGKDYEHVYEFSLKMKGQKGTKTRIDPIRPAKATWPSPADRTTIHPNKERKLTWRPGEKAKSHRVYLGADKSNLPLLDEVKKPKHLRLPVLEEDQTYYWRVDEVRTDGAVVAGDIWKFSLGKLIGWWKLDGDVKDSSGNDHHGVIHGNPKWVTGRIGDGLEFDGVDDYVDIGNKMDMSAFTVAVWVKSPAAPSSTSQSEVVCWESIGINWDQPGPFFRGAAGLRVGRRSYAASFRTLKANTWYHLCATYNGESLEAYKDGVLTMVNADPSGPPIAMKFGRHSLLFVENYFCGTIDDVRVYDYALKHKDIIELFKLAHEQ
ncbi:MAG: LamG-like jellyroll fold domain-containing protein [Planctomycetota bacterium]|jgi:predicted choloylglycine hydrolase